MSNPFITPLMKELIANAGTKAKEPSPRLTALVGHHKKMAAKHKEMALAEPEKKAFHEAQQAAHEELAGDYQNVIENSFDSVSSGIAKKEGISEEGADAILAKSSRDASPAAKRSNKKLAKVKN